MKPTCESCRFFQPDGEVTNPAGRCLRFPPHPVDPVDITARRWGYWPTVKPGDWCGEHKPSVDGAAR